jgi:hypothetical protein
MFKTFSNSSFLAESHLCPWLGDDSFPSMLNEWAKLKFQHQKKKSTKTEFFTREHNPSRPTAIV